MPKETQENLNVLLRIAEILYPKYNPYWFLLYMYMEYKRVTKRCLKYNLKRVSQQTILEYLRNSNNLNCDINNTVLVFHKNVYKTDKLLKLIQTNQNSNRCVFVVPITACTPQELLVSDTLHHNLSNFHTDSEVQLIDCNEKLHYAHEINLSLINTPVEINNSTIDMILESYFQIPKLVYKDDIIQINVQTFGKQAFYLNSKLNQVENIYFKCNKVIFEQCNVNGGYYCVIGETAIKQSVNIQSFVPAMNCCAVKNASTEVSLCPYGLQDYLSLMEKAVKPFIKKKNLRLKPVFLVQGDKGCGKEILISSLAAKLGMHCYKINNSELTASIYAQTETKLRNVFFNAKMAAPCILYINNFENFGKNNEGQYDERIMEGFAAELNILFENSPFPIILFCCSDTKNIPTSLQKLFLEIFPIDSPNDVQREQILKWILEYENIPTNNVDLHDIANKTHGFFFEDLKALVYYARMNKQRTNGTDAATLELCEDHFVKAVDHMQANYNESLGAPKIPKVQWSDVGGLTDVKEEIIKTINLPLKQPHLLKATGLKRSGILLFGPPGTGKTLIAKAVATECNMCFLSVKGPELLNMYVGQSEHNVREVFEKARQASPCIIFFDELDSLAPNRGMSGDSGGVMDRVVSQLLAEMDGLNESATIFIIGATNRPDLIDPALLRPGRFDKLLYIGPCSDDESKISVLKALTRKFNLADDVNFHEIIKSFPTNITGADFYGICSNAWSSAVRKIIIKLENGELMNADNLSGKNVIVCLDDFNTAIKSAKPSISPEDLRYFDKLKNEIASAK